MRKAFYFFILAACLVLFTTKAYATHLRAGEIIAQRDPSDPTGKTYIFTLILYRDTKGVEQQNATLDFGDGTTRTVEVGTKQRAGTGISNDIERLTYTFQKVYNTPGIYTVSFTEENRNDGVLNMIQSVQTAFHIETNFVIEPTLGSNNSVVFRNPPVDLATVGQRYCHNPAAFDPDGDSLAYRLVVPFQRRGTQVNGYQSPNKVGPPLGTPESGSGEATFTINPLTGDLCWDSPGAKKSFGGVITGPGEGQYGLYNVAFVVEEWRKTFDGTYSKVGEVRRDMQIVVRGNLNKRPELEIPPDTCIVAGSVLEQDIKATDPDRHRVSIGSESAIFSKDPNVFPKQPGATLTPFANLMNPVYQSSPAKSIFRWETNCSHVRAQPYDIVFRVEDDPPSPPFRKEDRLTDTKTWRVRVVGPKPTGLKATPSGKTMRLTWDPYASCVPPATQIIIWRKVGCTQDTIDPCKTGAPAGYEEVDRVPASTFSFVDNNKGKGLQTGVQYSYRIGAVFAPPAGGESAPSDAICVRLLLETPMITNVSVIKTDERAGEIEVRWTQPLEIDRTTFPGPYKYELYRATGIDNRSFSGSPIMSRSFNDISKNNDTVFIDKNLNTVTNGYNYVLLFYTGNQSAFKDSSQTASSVRLTVTPRPSAIELTWQANVPWDNTNQTHKLYRISNNNDNQRQFLADIKVGGTGTFRYIDNNGGAGLIQDSLYCYKIETYGTYNEPKIPSPLTNFSQFACSTPLDTLKPCPPVLAIDPLDCSKWEPTTVPRNREAFCNETTFSNRLDWTYPDQVNGQKCDKDVVKYRIYYSRYEGENETFVLLDSVVSPRPMPPTTYIHNNLPSFAGCYYVTAVDRSGNESLPSNIVCKDNCPYYELPNVITPNGDNKNDVFEPFPCPRFVESVHITIVNRWGKKVYESNRDVKIRWDGSLGKNGEVSGEDLTNGVYYYLAEVKFIRLRRKDEVVKIKGWVQILK